MRSILLLVWTKVLAMRILSLLPFGLKFTIEVTLNKGAIILLLTGANLFFFCASSFAQSPYTSVSSGPWDADATWSGVGIPAAGNTATIANGHNVSVSAAPAACATVNVNNGGTLTITGFTLTVTGTTTVGQGASGTLNISNTTGTLSTATLTVNGGATVTNNGTASTTTGLGGTGTFSQAATGILNIGGTSTITTLTATAAGNTVNYTGVAQPAAKVTTYSNLTLSGSGIKTFATTPTVNGVLSMEGTATVTVTGAGVVTYGPNATLQYNTATARAASTEEWISPFVGTGGIIITNTGTITTPGAVQIGNNTSVPLNINTGATLTPGANLITLHGDFINDGTLTSGTGGVTMAGTTATQSIDGFTTTGTVSMTKTAGTATLQGNVNGAILTINGLGGTLHLGAGLTHTFTGAWNRTNGTLNGGSSTLRIGGNVAGLIGTFTPGTSTVVYTGAGQAAAAVTYNNLTLSGSGAKTFATTPTVNGVLSMEGTATVTVTGAGVVTYGPNATLQYNTATARAASTEEWISPFVGTGGIIITNTGTITTPGVVQIGNNTSVTLNINTGATLTPGANLITLHGDFINDGTLTSGTGGVTMAGTTATQSIDGFTTTGTVSMTKTAGTATLQGNVNGAILTINGLGGTLHLGTGLTHTFTGAWNRTNGTLNGGSSTLRIGGNVAGATGTFTAGTGTVVYTGAGQTAAVVTYNNITLSGSGAKTFATTPTVNGVLSMEGTATVTVTGVGVVTYGPNATLQYNTATARAASTEEWISPFVGTGGIIITNTGAITTPGAVQIGNNTSVTLNINTGATLTPGANLITLHGDFINDGTLTSGTGGVTMAGTTATQSIDGFTTTGTVSMTKTAGTATLQGNVNGAILTINGLGGTLHLGAGLTHTFTGAWNRTNGTLNGGSSTLRIGGSVAGATGTFTAGTGTVEWNAAGIQTLAAVTYNNLILSGSGNKTFGGVTTVSGNLSITGTAVANLGAGLTHGANTLTLGGTGQPSGSHGGTSSAATYINPTYFTATTGIINTASCSGGVWRGVTSADWNTLSNWCSSIPISSTNVVIPSVGVANQPSIGAAGGLANDITISPGATLTIAGSNSLTVSGDWTNNGAFAANTSTVTFNGTTAIAGTAVTTFNNVSLVGATITTNNLNVNINANLSIDGSSSFDFSSTGNLIVGGVTQVNGTFTDSDATGTDTFSGLVTVTGTGTWNTTAVTSENRMNFNGGVTNSGNLTAGGVQIGPGQTVTANAATSFANGMDSSGDVIIAGANTVSLITADRSDIAGDLTITGNLTVATPGSGGNSLIVGGDLIVNGAFLATVATTSPMVFTGLVQVNAGGSFDTDAIADETLVIFRGGISHSGNTFSVGGATFNTNNQALTTTGASTINFANSTTVTGVTVTSSATVNTDDLTGTGTWVQGASTGSVLNYGGATIDITTFDPSGTGNTVDYNGNFAFQTVRGGGSYYNLELTGGLTITTAGSNFSVMGNFTKAGALAAFDANGTTITFNGTTAQSYTANSALTFFNLVVNNTFGTSPQLTLNNNGLTVSNVLTMTDGNINLNTESITISSSAAGALVHGGTSASGWMYGGNIIRARPDNTVIAVGSVHSLFPLGSPTDWRPFFAGQNNNGNTGGNMTVSHTDGTGSTTVAYAEGIVRRHNSLWTVAISGGIAGGPTWDLRAGGTNFGTIEAGAAGLADLRMSTSTGVVGTHAASTGGPDYRVNRTGISFANLANSYHVASTDAVNSPLPIELIYFKAQVVEDAIKLTWSTASESNNDFFSIERGSNIEEFQVIGELIHGKGTTFEKSDYITWDASPLYGRSYYRLKQTDFDGKFTYSDVKVVDYDGPRFSTLNIYPNPSNGHGLTLEALGLKDQPTVPVQIFNVQGQKVFDQVLDVTTPGTLTQNLEFSTPLKQGLYIIKAGQTLQLTQKLIVD